MSDSALRQVVSDLEESHRYRVSVPLRATPDGFIRWLSAWSRSFGNDDCGCFLTVADQSEGVLSAELETYDQLGPSEVRKIKVAWYNLVKLSSESSALTANLLDRNSAYVEYYTRTLEEAVALFGLQTGQPQLLPWQDGYSGTVSETMAGTGFAETDIHTQDAKVSLLEASPTEGSITAAMPLEILYPSPDERKRLYMPIPGNKRYTDWETMWAFASPLREEGKTYLAILNRMRTALPDLDCSETIIGRVVRAGNRGYLRRPGRKTD